MSKRPSTTEGTRSLSIHLASATWEVEAALQHVKKIEFSQVNGIRVF